MNLFFFTTVLLIICIIYVGYPLFFKKLKPLDLSNAKEDLFTEQQLLLTSLSDLEEEYLLGKTSKKDFHFQRLMIQRKYLVLQKSPLGK